MRNLSGSDRELLAAIEARLERVSHATGGYGVEALWLDESELYDPLAGPDALYINLEREFKLAEQSYGTDHLDLVLAKGYLCKLLANARVLRYLAQHHQEILIEFQRIADLETVAA